MKVLAAGMLVIAFSATGAGAEVRWIRMQSANFEMYSSASEKSTRETLAYFEQVRGIFAQAMVKTTEKPLPVRIVAFGSRKDFLSYRINDFANAYYQGTAERDYIVLSETGDDTFPTAVHEYFHLFARHAQLNLPPWLNEGMAELYSTLRPRGDRILVGAVMPGRLRAMRMEPWVPLAVILSADRSSPYYNEKDKAGSLYNEGWALTHMLSLDERYLPKFSNLLAAIQSGMPSEQALMKVYGTSVAKIEQDLQLYLRGNIFNGVWFPVKIEKTIGQTPAETVPDFDVKLMLADLANRPGKEQETRKTFEALSQEDPKRPEPFAQLGYLAARSGRSEEAEADFGKAFSLGAREPKLLWDYGRMAEANRPAEAVRAFEELMKQQPDRADVRIELAAAQLRDQHSDAAIESLAAIAKVPEENAPRFFSILSAAQWREGNVSEALKAAIGLASVAKTREDREQADHLLKALANPGAAAATRNVPPPRDLRVTPRPRAAQAAAAAPAGPRASITGSLIQLDCQAMEARLTIETMGGKKTFLIEDPSNIRVAERSDETVDLPCGPGKPASVRIEYSLPADGQSGVDGIVRFLQIQP